MFLYTLVLSPFRVSEQYLSDGARAMRDALAFKSQLVENIDAKDVSYFEYITREYKDYSQEQLVKNIILFTRLNFVLYFLTYFLVG